MKQIKFKKQLSLNKETIANLSQEQMNSLRGGMEISEQVCNFSRTCNSLCGCIIENAPQQFQFTPPQFNNMIGWVQNRGYNWQDVLNSGVPPTVNNGTITLNGFSNDGIYNVQWFDCLAGNFVYSATANCSEGTLLINVPPVQWDYAYSISYAQSDKLASIQNEVINSNVTTYPNPFNSAVTFEVLSDASGNYELTLYDYTGKQVKKLSGITTKKFVVDRNDLVNGIYFYTLYNVNSNEMMAKDKLIIQ